MRVHEWENGIGIDRYSMERMDWRKKIHTFHFLNENISR